MLGFHFLGLIMSGTLLCCRYMYFGMCAVGFSAVLFGLKVVLNYNSPGYSSILGISLPTKVCSEVVPIACRCSRQLEIYQ